MPYFFLEKDAVALRKELDTLEQQKLSVAQDAAIHVDQSSESYHDNAGFEIALREQMSLAGKTLEIRRMLDKTVVVRPDSKITKADICSEIVLKDLDSGEKKTFIISSYQILDRRDAREISYTAPIIQPFVSKRRGTKKKIATPNGEKKYELLSIRAAQIA
jgi:transcription elongation GreA/GreB family factor